MNLLTVFILSARMVYHCPSCNSCRLGKGLGSDFYHCMTCNCCLSVKLVDHKWREKGLETNCPICCDFLFTSGESVRALPLGHFMHSSCFQVSASFPQFSMHLTCFFFCTSFGKIPLIYNMRLLSRSILAATTFVQSAAGHLEIWR